MRISKVITTIDSHTAGEGTRLVTGGLPPIPGPTMAGKLAYAARHLAWLPGLSLLEPRGHKDLFGAVLVPPCAPEADAGVLFVDNAGFEPMCGHGVIGVVTCLLEMGTFAMQEPETRLTLDTAAGLVRASARVCDGRVKSVTFENVPAYVVQQQVPLSVPDLGKVVVDVAFGGLFFVLIPAESLGLELVPANAPRFAELGMAIRAAANEQLSVRHPEMPSIDRILDVRFTAPGRDGTDSRNVVALGERMIDRSPCGTGTCAEMALRHARGELPLQQPFIAESIVGTRFTGRLLGETSVGSGVAAVPAVRPCITGSAYITGLQQLILQPDDPFPEGLSL